VEAEDPGCSTGFSAAKMAAHIPVKLIGTTSTTPILYRLMLNV